LQGLDPGRYKSTTIAEADERRFSALDSQLPDSERYKDAAPFIVRCRACECSVGFAPVANRAVRLSLRSISALESSRHVLGVVGQGQRSYVPHVQ
jgi:DNA polymerase alpha subunit A